MTTATTKYPFNVWITPTCLEKLNLYATHAVLEHNSEIGGFARIQEEGNDVFVTDIFIPTQEATGGTFDITAEMDGQFMRHMMKTGQREDLPNWKSLVHSHPVGMGPSMSGTDVTAIQRRAEDSECFSLIISASRTADSTRLAMHYCANIFGKKMIFHDMPVQVGWDIERREHADQLAAAAAKVLGAESKADLEQLQSALRMTLCTEMPPTWEKERRALSETIKAEVKEKVSSPQAWRTPAKPWTRSETTTPQLELLWRGARENRSTVPYTDRADLDKAWEMCQRMYAIGYDKVDPGNPNPKNIVTKEDAKRARRLYKKAIMELNTQLRELGSVGMGDLVLVNQLGVDNNPDVADLAIEPCEAEDFQINNGVLSIIVGGEILWPEELVVMTPYEELMGWTKDEVPA